MQADRIATNNIVRFQELLNNEIDDSRYRILSQLPMKAFSTGRITRAARTPMRGKTSPK